MFLLSSSRLLSFSHFSFSIGRDGSRKSYFEIASTEDSFDLKGEFCRANRELFETTDSTARRNHYVEAMQFRKHVRHSRDSFYNSKSSVSGFRINVHHVFRYLNGEHVLINPNRI